MGDVGELYIRIAFETDPAGAQDAVEQLGYLKREMKSTGYEVRQFTSNYNTMGRSLITAIRPFNMLGMGITNLGMLLLSTGAISQDTATKMGMFGMGVQTVSSAVQMGAVALRGLGAYAKIAGEKAKEAEESTTPLADGFQWLDATASGATIAAKGFTAELTAQLAAIAPLLIAFAALAVAVAAVSFAWEVHARDVRIAKGEYKDLASMMKDAAADAAEQQLLGRSTTTYDVLAEQLRNYVETHKDWVDVQNKVKASFEGINPQFTEYLRLTNEVPKAKAKVQDLTDKIAELDKEMTFLTKVQNEWVDALRDQERLTDAIDKGERNLIKNKQQLNNLIAQQAFQTDKMAEAQYLYETRQISADEYYAAVDAFNSYNQSVQDSRDAIADQTEENAENRTELETVTGVIQGLVSQYGSLEGLTAKIMGDETQRATWVTDLGTAETELANMSSSLATMDKEYPVFKEMADFTIKNPEDYDKAIRYLELLQAVGNKAPPTAVGGIEEGFMGGSGGLPPMEGFQRGTPYVPETGPAILHKGEAVIPANQNSYVDAIHIKSMSLGQGYGMDQFMKDRDRAIRVKRKMLGYVG